MLRRNQLRSRRCVPDLIRIVDQMGQRAAARAPLRLDMPVMAMLLFWTMLRDERTWLLLSLEEMGVDMWRLTCDVDSLISQEKTHGEAAGEVAVGLPPERARTAVDPFVTAWLDRAEQEAQLLGHRYLGVEHLLLAIVAEADPRLSAVLACHGMEYSKLHETITAALSRLPPPPVPDVLDTYKPWGTGWDKPAVGVPRRYSLAMILGMTAVYALIFAVMRMLDAHVAVFIFVTVFFTAVSLGQPLLFGGRYPRAASMLIGAVLLPLEFMTTIILIGIAQGGSRPPLAAFLCTSLAGIPLGALFGYLLGCIGAGLFCVMDWYKRKRQRSQPPADPAAFDPFLKSD